MVQLTSSYGKPRVNLQSGALQPFQDSGKHGALKKINLCVVVKWIESKGNRAKGKVRKQ